MRQGRAGAVQRRARDCRVAPGRGPRRRGAGTCAQGALRDVATPVTMPVLGLTMEEGTVAEWLKAEGDSVAKDEPLLTVEMDKGTVEVPSPAAGIVRRIVVQPGTTVPVRTLIAEIGDRGEAISPVVPPSASPTAPASSPTTVRTAVS